MENSAKLRVVILSSSADGTVGGVERFSQNLAEQLRSFADVSIVIAPECPSKWARRLGLVGACRSWAARREIRSANPNVLITNGAMGWVGRTEARHIHVYHGTMPCHSLADRSQKRFREWFVAGVVGGGFCEWLSGLWATRVAVSASVQSEVANWYGFRTIVIENGVRLRTLGSASRSGLVFVGRRESRKGYEVAVATAAKMGDTLVVAGPGIDVRTRNLGQLQEPEVSALMQKALAFIFPTRYEACSLAILEAMMSGCPVITTSVGWMKSLLVAVPEYSLLIDDSRDPYKMASTVLALEDPGSPHWRAVEAAHYWVIKHNSLESFGRSWIGLVFAGKEAEH